MDRVQHRAHESKYERALRAERQRVWDHLQPYYTALEDETCEEMTRRLDVATAAGAPGVVVEREDFAGGDYVERWSGPEADRICHEVDAFYSPKVLDLDRRLEEGFRKAEYVAHRAVVEDALKALRGQFHRRDIGTIHLNGDPGGDARERLRRAGLNPSPDRAEAAGLSHHAEEALLANLRHLGKLQRPRALRLIGDFGEHAAFLTANDLRRAFCGFIRVPYPKTRSEEKRA